MTTTTVWEATRPVPRRRVWADAALALEFHYRRLALTLWRTR